MNPYARVRDIVRRSKAGEGVIHWNPGKFLQLQPDFDIHLNFWGNPFTGMGAGVSPCHTHDYGFTSEVVFGCVVNVRMDVAPVEEYPTRRVNREHMMFRKYRIIDAVGDNSFDEFVPSPDLYTILRSRLEEVRAGNTYQMDPRDWHASISVAPAITLLDMWKHAPIPYYTLGPVDVRQAYPTSDRRTTPDQLPAVWDYVDGMLKLAGIEL